MSESPKSAPTEKEPDFEEAVRTLESIVDSMESGDLSLDDLIRRFEEGAKLVHLCQHHLNGAELKIEKLRENLKDLDFEPFEPEGPSGN